MEGVRLLEESVQCPSGKASLGRTNRRAIRSGGSQPPRKTSAGAVIIKTEPLNKIKLEAMKYKKNQNISKANKSGNSPLSPPNGSRIVEFFNILG